MKQGTKNRIALGVAIACGVAAVIWRNLRPAETPAWRATATTAPADSRATTATPQSNGDRPSAPSAAPLPYLDRKRADEMREQIKKLMAEAGPAWALSEIDAAPGSSRPVATNGVYPEMPSSDEKDNAGDPATGKYIQRRVREDLFPLAKQCYQEQLDKNPKLAGRFVMHFRIVGDKRIGGVVDTATMDDSSTLKNPEFSRCMTESMMSITFDAPPGKSGEVTVTYPIEFSPEDPDGGDGG